MAVLNLSYFYKVGAVVLVHMNDSRLGYIGIPISLRDGSCTVAFLEVSITFVSKILDSQRVEATIQSRLSAPARSLHTALSNGLT